MTKSNKKVIENINIEGLPVSIYYDMSNLMIRYAYVMYSQLADNAFTDWGLFKHGVISNILDFKKYFEGKPEIVLAYDKKKDGIYWRNKVSEYYKAHRGEWTSNIPKDVLFSEFDDLYNGMKECFPWKSFKMPGIEADDIIAVLVQKHKGTKNQIVVSGDGDFQQLIDEHTYVYNPIKHQLMTHMDVDANRLRFDKIMKGDSGDGVSSYLDDEDTVVNPHKRRKPIRTAKLTEMYEVCCTRGWEGVYETYLPSKEMKSKVELNCLLVDMRKIPVIVSDRILNEYNSYQTEASANTAMKYLSSRRLRELIERIEEII